MTIMRVFGGAFRDTYRNAPLVATLYGTNLLFASVIALAFRGFVADLGNAASLGPLLNDFDMTLFSDFMRTHGDALNALWHAVGFMALLSAVVSAVTSGGILALLESDTIFSLREFLQECGTFAFRFLRLLVLTGLTAIVAGVALIAVAGAVIGATTRVSTSEIPLLQGITVAVAASGVLLMIVLMTSDYARVLAVSTDSRSMVRTLGKSLQFLARNAPGAIGLQAMMALLTFCLFALYLFLSGVLEMNSPWRVVTVFLIQQAFVLCRSFLRVMLFSCEVGFTRSRQAAPQSL